MQLPIPDDWSGEDWRDFCITWPSSESWLTILRGFLGTPMQGRFWDARTGSIKAVQDTGWQIWLRNENAPGCNENCPDCPDCPEQEPCGGALIESEEDMGQVVTDITIENGVLYKYFGPCCKVAVTGSLSGGGIQLTDPVNPEDITGDTYSPCGKLTGVMDALWSLAAAVWDVKDDPYANWVGYVRSQNPGLTVDSSQVVASVGAALIVDDTYSESEVFDTGIWQQIKCQMVGQFTDELDGLSETVWIMLYQTISAVFAGAGRLAVGDWWAGISSMLGYTGANNQALLGSQDFLSDCNCPDVGPDSETEPDAQGWYMSAPLDATFFVGSSVVDCYGVIEQVTHDVYGFFFRINTSQEDVVKRMSCGNTGGGLDANFTEVDQSVTADSSDHLETSNQAYPFIQIDDDDIGASLAAQRGYDIFTKKTGGVDGTVISTPDAVGGQTLGIRIEVDKDVTYHDLLEVRFIHNINSPSHSA